MNTPARSMQHTAAARAAEAARLRAENPKMTFEEIGEIIGVSKQRVGQMLRKPPQERWSEELLAAMCACLEQGGTPQDLLAVPGVSDKITAERPRGRLTEDADREQTAKRLGNLRKLICTGKDAPEGTPARRLHDARQKGLALVVMAMSEPVVAATVAALRRGSKYAEVLGEVPQLGEVIGGDRDRQATLLRVLVDSGADRPAGTTARRLYEARKAGARKAS